VLVAFLMVPVVAGGLGLFALERLGAVFKQNTIRADGAAPALCQPWRERGLKR
jgi:hypothetical protein